MSPASAESSLATRRISISQSPTMIALVNCASSETFLAIILRTAIVQRDRIEGEFLRAQLLSIMAICAEIGWNATFCLALIARSNYHDQCRLHPFSQNCGEILSSAIGNPGASNCV